MKLEIASQRQPPIDCGTAARRTPRHRLAKSRKRRHQVQHPAVHQRPLAVPGRNPPKLLDGTAANRFSTKWRIPYTPESYRRGTCRFARGGITAVMSRSASSASAALVSYAWSAISSLAGMPSSRADSECGLWALPGVSLKPTSQPPHFVHQRHNFSGQAPTTRLTPSRWPLRPGFHPAP